MSKKSLRQIYVAYGLVFLWMLVIFLFSHQPAEVSDLQSGFFVNILDLITPQTDSGLLTFLTRKSAHIFSYLVLGFLTFNAIRLHKLPLIKTSLISTGLIFVYALSDEFHQLFIPGRSGEVRDVMIDVTAGLVGIGICAMIQHFRLPRLQAGARSSKTL